MIDRDAGHVARPAPPLIHTRATRGGEQSQKRGDMRGYFDPTTATPLVVAYGGGVNSTAVLAGLQERGIRPAAIVFADTGGEKPATYAFLDTVDTWLASVGFPAIERVARKPTERAGYKTLEEECLERSQLPSRAYLRGKCSAKWKVSPQAAWLKSWPHDGLVYRAIGFHVDEQRRIKDHITDPGVKKVYPLVEWQWGQRECLDAIARAGLPRPVKSACFYCPSSSKREVAKLAREAPDLFARAVAIENGAIASGMLRSVVGLGVNWRWQDVGRAAVAQDWFEFPDDAQPLPCGCHDGGDPDDDDDEV